MQRFSMAATVYVVIAMIERRTTIEACAQMPDQPKDAVVRLDTGAVRVTSGKRRCLVIGPIGTVGSEQRKHADMLLNAVVKAVLEADDFGYEVVRSDQVAEPGMINDRVIHDILNAELVVADLTFLNANAFYELGIRHAALKPAIHIAQAGTSLAFDTFGYRAIVEDITDWQGIVRAREQLRKAATAIEEPDYKVSNPITQANAGFQMQESADPKDRILIDLKERLDTLARSLTPMLKPRDITHSGKELMDILQNTIRNMKKMQEPLPLEEGWDDSSQAPDAEISGKD
jgi:hypothetical protein